MTRPADPLRSTRVSGGVALGVVAYALLYLLPLGQRPLQTPDELRYAEVAREMEDSGNWWVPQLDGLPYLEKPPLGYWLMAGSARLLGKGAFAARLPSALATGLCALLIGVLLRVGAHSLRAQTLAPLVFLTSAEVHMLGTTAILDPLFTATLTGSVVCGYLAWQTDVRGTRTLALLGAGALAALSFATKGFLALALPAVIFGPFLLWQGQTRGLLRHGWIALVAFGVVTLPWALAIHAHAPGFWHDFVYVQHVERFASAQADHPRPFWYLAPFLLAGMLPWILLGPAALAGLRGLDHPLRRLAVCGVVGPLLLLSCSRGKLGTYVLPCLPFLALLIGLGLDRCASEGGVHRTPARVGALACLGIVLLLALDAAAAPFGLVREYAADLRIPVLAFGAAGASWMFFEAARVPLRRGCGWFAAAAGCLVLAVTCGVRDGGGRFAPAEFVSRVRPAIPPRSWLVADSACLYALVFALDRSDVYLVRPGELGSALAEGAGAERLWGETGLREQLLDPTRDRAVAVCVARERLARLRPSLPVASTVLCNRKLVLAVFAPSREGSEVASASIERVHDLATPSRDRPPGDLEGGCADAPALGNATERLDPDS